MYSLKEAAASMEITPVRLRQLCQAGRVLNARKIAGVWIIESLPPSITPGRRGPKRKGTSVYLPPGNKNQNIQPPLCNEDKKPLNNHTQAVRLNTVNERRAHLLKLKAIYEQGAENEKTLARLKEIEAELTWLQPPSENP